MTSHAFPELRQGSRHATPVVVAIVLLLAALAGAATGLSGMYVIAAVVALIGGLVMFYRPILGMLIFAGTIPVENLLVFDGMTATRLLGLAVFGAWAGRKLLLGESWKPMLASGTAALVGMFLVWVLLSAIWAEHPNRSLSGFAQLVQLAVLGLLIVDLCSSWQRLDALAKALVVGGALAILLTLQQSLMPGVRRAGEDIAGGVNMTAIVLLTVLPFAFYLIRSDQRLPWRVLGVAFIAGASAAIALTFSRMNMLLLPFTLTVLTVLTLWDGRGRRWLLVVALAGVLGTAFLPWDEVLERAETISDYVQGTVAAASTGAEDTSGRGYHLRVGLAIASDHPIIGAGYNNYGELFRSRYQFVVPGTTTYYGSIRSPHSSLIGLLADVGVIGTLLWLGILLSCGWGLVTVWRRPIRSSPEALILIEGAAIALFLHALPYAFYVPNQKEKILWLLIGMAVAMRSVSKDESHDTGTREVDPEYSLHRSDARVFPAAAGNQALHRI